MLQRLPIPALRPFVAQVWASEGGSPGGAGSRDVLPLREHVLPTGMMHLVVRLSEEPLRIASAREGMPAQSLGTALVGGARSGFYVRELSGPSFSVGAVLRPGAAACLFGATSDELAGRHTPLEDLWRASARTLREQLMETSDGEGRLALLEASLLARLPRLRSLHPAIASALTEHAATWSVAAAVQRSGVSHRRFIALFQQAVGLPPKTWLRVRRFQHALTSLRRDDTCSLASMAVDLGYSDQSHFNRDFLAFAGVTPMAYRHLGCTEANHLPVDSAGSSGRRA